MNVLDSTKGASKYVPDIQFIFNKKDILNSTLMKNTNGKQNAG